MNEMSIAALETEWARYKYCILERSPQHYQKIRQLLREKGSYPALKMYRSIEDSFDLQFVPGNRVNAGQHVWGYFKDKASEAERRRFQTLLQKFSSGEAGIQLVKNHLLRLAEKYQEDYLLSGYYFYI